MQDTATTDTAQQPVVDKSKAALAALEASFTALSECYYVTPGENEAKVKAASKEAKKLLKQLRGDNEPVVQQVEELFIALNANISPDQQRQIDLATEQFKQSVTRVDNQILNQYIQAVQDGDYAAAEAILKNAEQSQQTHTLMFALLTIGTILLPLYARQRIQALFTQFALHTVFAQTDSSREALREQAEKGAESHVRTIAKDIKNALDDAIDNELTNPVIEAAVKDKFEELANKDGKEYLKAVHGDQNIYKYARDLILKGETRQNVIKKLQENFSEVGKRRANVIAGNEANRVFTMSQFDADSQFLAQNKLTTKAYKRLVSNTGHPEAICKAIIDATAIKPIPFKSDFLPFGKEFVVKTQVDGKAKTYKFTPNYEHLKAGHIHVNCHCRYELMIKKEDGTFMNAVNDVVPFIPALHPRDKDGKFSLKGTIGHLTLNPSKLGTKEDFDTFVANADRHYTKEQEAAASIYQSPHGYALNNSIRVGDKTFSVRGKKLNTTKVSSTLDSTFNMTIPEESTLYRGVGDSPQDFIVGRNYLDVGYTSTSSVEGTARTKFKAPGGAVIHLTVPAGTKVSVPDLVSGKTNLNEQELLLPKGSSYSVYKIDGDIIYAVMV